MDLLCARGEEEEGVKGKKLYMENTVLCLHCRERE